ncbi:YhbD family protein [Neobacillus mesonae]|nr:YhbD family protein [Neobacillus mesonae]
MPEDLISKKELLEITGISYGQLYRWKRKNLIPEDWFIRRSSFTGQETFFPRESILSRIAKIKNMKDDLSLDELADVFSPSVSTLLLTQEELEHKQLVSPITFNLYLEHAAALPSGEFGFEQVLCLYVLDQALFSGQITRDEGILLIHTFQSEYSKFEDKGCDIILIRKMGIPIFMMVSTGSGIYYDMGVKEALRLPIPAYVEQLKVQLNQSGGYRYE